MGLPAAESAAIESVSAYMFFYEGLSCPVCGQPFKETDDIVSCPECGAPHHRDCWKQEGRCHYTALHGTKDQWTRPEPVSQPNSQSGSGFPGQTSQSQGPTPGGKRCPYCGNLNTQYAEFCSRCGRDLPSSDWSSSPPPSYGPYVPPPNQASPYGPPGGYGEYAPFHMPVNDPYGGVGRDESIEDVTADEAVQVIAVNSQYYLPRFKRMSQNGSRVSWNWPAFLITPCWLLYRKNLLAGILTLAFWVARSALSMIISVQLIYPLMSEGTYLEMYQAIEALMASSQTRLILIALLLAGFTEFLLRIFFGLFGNYFYMRQVVRKAKKWREDPNARYKQNLLTSGGISFALGTVAYLLIFCTQYLVIFFY